ncbi:hypothetical protein RQP46_000007 [Phenoliferia psychrophenolica]
MATLPSFPAELLSHILDLSTEGESAEARQRARFAFGLIARAFFLATTNTTDFHVASESQAKGLILKLEQEKESMAQDEKAEEERKLGKSNVTSSTFSMTRVSNIRRLALVIETSTNQTGFVNLLLLTPHLFALELTVTGTTYRAISQPLELALRQLKGLQKLSFRSLILIPLKALRVLKLEVEGYYQEVGHKIRLRRLSLPHLQTVQIRLQGAANGFPNSFFGALATTSSRRGGIKSLHLHTTRMHIITSQTLLPHVTQLVHLTWTPEPRSLKVGHQDAVLALLGAMKNLQSIFIPVWVTPGSIRRPWASLIDHSLLETLAKLPLLHSVTLLIRDGILVKSQAIGYMRAHKSLKALCLQFDKDTAWMWEEREEVQDAAEQAGVAFSCSG